MNLCSAAPPPPASRACASNRLGFGAVFFRISTARDSMTKRTLDVAAAHKGDILPIADA